MCIPCQAAKALLNRTTNIVEGNYNLLFKNEETEKTAKARYEVCMACPNKKPLIIVGGIQRYICTKCSCPLDAKVRAPDDVCPVGNW